MSSPDDFLHRYSLWLLQAMTNHSHYYMLPTYKNRLEGYENHVNKSTETTERFLNKVQRDDVIQIIKLFYVYLQKNDLEAVEFLSNYSKKQLRRKYFDTFPEFKVVFMNMFREFFKHGQKTIFNFTVDSDPKNYQFLTLMAHRTNRIKECSDIVDYLKRFTSKAFKKILEKNNLQSFCVEIDKIKDDCLIQRRRLNVATKEQFLEIRKRYNEDKKNSNFELNFNGPEKKNCFMNEECLLQPVLFSNKSAYKVGSVTSNKLELSATQEFFKKTMHALVENKKEKLPNVLVNYWGTGTGKTLGSLLFVCAADITDCFIMVHSADMISSFMSDFESDIGKFVIQQELGILKTDQTWNKIKIVSDSTAKYELKNGDKKVIKTIYFMVYGYLFNEPVYEYRGGKKNSDTLKSLIQFHNTLWDKKKAEKKFALIMDEAHSLRNSEGAWYENVISFFTEDTQNQRVSSELLPVQRTLLMTATLAANRIDQATHVLDLGCILTNSKDYATKKIKYVPTVLQNFFKWCVQNNKDKGTELITKEVVEVWNVEIDKNLSYYDEVIKMLIEKTEGEGLKFSVVENFDIELNQRFTFSETYESMQNQKDKKKKEKDDNKKMIAKRIQQGKERKAVLKKAEIFEKNTVLNVADKNDQILSDALNEKASNEKEIPESGSNENVGNGDSDDAGDSDFDIEDEISVGEKPTIKKRDKKKSDEPIEIRRSKRGNGERKTYTNQDDDFENVAPVRKPTLRRHKSDYETKQIREISKRMNQEMEELKNQFESETNINGELYYLFLLDLNQTMKDSGVAIIRGLGGDEGMPDFDGKRAFLAPTTTPNNRGLLFWANTPYEVEMPPAEFVKLMKYIDACKKYDDKEYPAENSAYRKLTSAYFDMDYVKLPLFYFKSEQNKQRPKGKKRKIPEDEQLEPKTFKYCDLGTFAADAALKAIFASGDKSQDYRYHLFKNILRRVKESSKTASMFIVQDSKKIEIKKEMIKIKNTFILKKITFTKSDGTEPVVIKSDDLKNIFRRTNKQKNKNADDKDEDADADSEDEKEPKETDINEGVDEDVHFDSALQKKLIKQFSEQVFDEIDNALLLASFQDKKMQSVVASVVHLAKNKENGPIAVFGEHTDGCDSIAHFIFRMVEQGFSIQEHVKIKQNQKQTTVKKPAKGQASTKKEPNEAENVEYKTMVAYTGTSDDYSALKGVEARRVARDTFNSEENVDGKNIKIMILTAAGSTGLTLKNTHIMIDMHVPEDVVVKQQKQGRTVRRTVSEKFYAGFTRAKIAEHNNKLPRVTEYSFLSTFPKEAIWPPEKKKEEESDNAENQQQNIKEEEEKKEQPQVLKKRRTKSRFTGGKDDEESSSDDENGSDSEFDVNKDEFEYENPDDASDDEENYAEGEVESEPESDSEEEDEEEKNKTKGPPVPTPQVTFDQKTMKSVRSKVAIGNFQSLAFTSVALNAKAIVKDLGESFTLVIPLGESLF